MRIPMKIIVILMILLLVLISFAAFIALQSRGSISKGEQQKTFSLLCEEYKKELCDWSVTKHPDFAKFMEACKKIYGVQREEYSCLYQLCCRMSETSSCEANCKLCEGNLYAGLPSDAVKECCNDFNSKCSSRCSVC